jgi:ABC-type taurine transport system ATPase subunit
MLTMQDLTVRYEGVSGGPCVLADDPVNPTLGRDEFVVNMGPGGCGKTGGLAPRATYTVSSGRCRRSLRKSAQRPRAKSKANVRHNQKG